MIKLLNKNIVEKLLVVNLRNNPDTDINSYFSFGMNMLRALLS